jgi:hypothetical protein
MPLFITAEAEAQLALRRNAWSDRDLAELLGDIERRPESFAPFIKRGGHAIRRAVMRRCHLYFEVRDDGQVWVLTAGGRR